jgi:hypothetical protein
VLAADEIEPDRWRTGLAQLDRSRELLLRVGVAARPDDVDLDLELTTPPSARLFLDALRAVSDIEVQRLASAATDQVHLPLRQIPVLRNFLVDAEQRLRKMAKNMQPLLDASEKRTPRSVRPGDEFHSQ